MGGSVKGVPMSKALTGFADSDLTDSVVVLDCDKDSFTIFDPEVLDFFSDSGILDLCQCSESLD